MSAIGGKADIGNIAIYATTAALIEAQQIHAAIGRIDDGTYGECSTCGKAIGEKRLQALPYAIQCIDCVTE